MATAKQYEKTVETLLQRSSRPRTTENLLHELASAHGDLGMDEVDLDALLSSFPALLRTPKGWRLTKRTPPPREAPESDLDQTITLLLEHSKGALGIAAIFAHVERVAPYAQRQQVLKALQHPRIERTAPGRYRLHPSERERRAHALEHQEQENPLHARAHATLDEDGTPRSSRALAQRCGTTTTKLHAALAGDERFVYDEEALRWGLAAWDDGLRALLAPAASDALEHTTRLHALLRDHGDTTLATLATLSGIPRASLLELLRAQAGVFVLTERHRVGGTKHVSYGVSLTHAACSARPLARVRSRGPEAQLRSELRRAHPRSEARAVQPKTSLSARDVLAKLLAPNDEPN